MPLGRTSHSQIKELERKIIPMLQKGNGGKRQEGQDKGGAGQGHRDLKHPSATLWNVVF
jgi:hypothetical protein